MKIPVLYDIEIFIRNIKRNNIFTEIYNIRKELQLLQEALLDEHLGLFKLRLKNAKILPKYYDVFYKIRENDICIDCGANQGLVSDIFLQMGAEVYSFEPHKDLYNILLYKYKGNNNIHLLNNAVGAENSKMPFYISAKETFANLATTTGASCCTFDALVNNKTVSKYDIDMIDLCEYIKKNIVDKGKRVYILKIDIEGAEWDLLKKIIETRTYENIDYIFCEEHSRLQKDGKQKLDMINKMIEENNISNIYLDWF